MIQNNLKRVASPKKDLESLPEKEKKDILEGFQKPCNKAELNSLIIKLCDNKRVDKSDPESLKRMLQDVKNCLASMPKYAVALGIVEMIYDTEKAFFSGVAEINEMCRKNIVNFR